MQSTFSSLAILEERKSGEVVSFPVDYLLLTLYCGVLIDPRYPTFESFSLFADIREDELRPTYKQFFAQEAPESFPHEEAFACLLSSLDPDLFSESFVDWAQQLHTAADQQVKLHLRPMPGIKKLDPWQVEEEPKPSTFPFFDFPTSDAGFFTVRIFDSPAPEAEVPDTEEARTFRLVDSSDAHVALTDDVFPSEPSEEQEELAKTNLNAIYRVALSFIDHVKAKSGEKLKAVQMHFQAKGLSPIFDPDIV